MKRKKNGGKCPKGVCFKVGCVLCKILQKIKVLVTKNFVAKISKFFNKYFSDGFSDGGLSVAKDGVAKI